jgi:hypothetical protein
MSFVYDRNFPNSCKAWLAAFFAVCSLMIFLRPDEARPEDVSLAIRGEVLAELSLSMADILAMSPFLIRDVPVIPERVRDRKDEERVTQTTFRGVLLRDLLYRAGMKHKRKWEPGVLIRVINKGKRESLFSFGEIFYSSVGRSVLIAYERDGKSCPLTLVVATDIHDGRMMTDVSEIRVARVEIELLAYQDKANSKVRPPSAEFNLVDQIAQKRDIIRPADLEALPAVHVPAAVLIGDCEGFHGIHSMDGVSLSSLIKKVLTIPDPAPYNRYVLIASDDGYCATFSFGELFNSRMGDSVVIATVKDGKPLSSEDGFAMSIVGEDSAGGRSVKRIQRIELR